MACHLAARRAPGFARRTRHDLAVLEGEELELDRDAPDADLSSVSSGAAWLRE